MARMLQGIKALCIRKYGICSPCVGMAAQRDSGKGASLSPLHSRRFTLASLTLTAGVMLVPERKTQDGFELHFGLNYLGHFLLTNLLLDTLRQSGRQDSFARIVTISSATHYVADLDLEDLQSR